jgi:eukaryotic-like serine/threonine-protein kinase
MAVVYEAEHLGTQRRVALKFLKSMAMLGEDGDTWWRRFSREARVAGSIDNPHITQVFDAGTDESTQSPFIAMELLTGEDLANAIRRCDLLAPEVVLRVAGQACLGLIPAHQRGIIHRDIKPGNLFLAQDGAGSVVVKLLDFGVAKVRLDQTGSGELTQTGATIGTPSYMSPEQVRGLRSIDSRADIWSLGIVMYRAMAGRLPYDTAQGSGSLMISICTEDPVPIGRPAPWLSPEIQALVTGTLQRDPNRRYQSAEDLLNAIRALLPGGDLSLTREMFEQVSCEVDGLGSSGASTVVDSPPLAQNTGPARTGPQAPSAEESVAAVGTDARRPSESRSWVLPIAAVLSLFVLGALAVPLVFWVQARRSQAQVAPPPSAVAAPAAAVASVKLQVTVQPPVEASIVVGGRTQKGSRGEFLLPRSDAPVAVVVTADGFDRAEISVTPDKDNAVLVGLPVAAPASPTPSSASPAAARPVARREPERPAAKQPAKEAAKPQPSSEPAKPAPTATEPSVVTKNPF